MLIISNFLTKAKYVGNNYNKYCIRLTSVSGKVTEKIALGDTERQLKNKAVFRKSQHGFVKVKSCLRTAVISFNEKVTLLVDKGKVVDLAFLHFSQAFDPVPHTILLDQLPNCTM